MCDPFALFFVKHCECVVGVRCVTSLPFAPVGMMGCPLSKRFSEMSVGGDQVGESCHPQFSGFC